MRLIHYHIVNKATGKKVYTNCRLHKCEEILATMENKENFCISHKWVSI